VQSVGRIWRAAIDGIAHALLLVGMNELLSSTWVESWPVEMCFVLSLIAGLLSAAVFVLCIRGETRIWRLCLWSMAFCLLTWGLTLVNAMEWHVRLLPLREGSSGDGLLLVLATGEYLVVSLGLRGLVWLMAAIWRWAGESS